MATFFIIIVPALILKDGKHKIRIAMTHNGQTRYIATNITIDSIKGFKSGRIVKRNDKDILNLQLKKICDQYEENYTNVGT